jgi:5-methyltetrahydropteroyltriglutamate--homocysteine methyltransferase
MLRSDGRFRTTHAGSLVRPPTLVARGARTDSARSLGYPAVDPGDGPPGQASVRLGQTAGQAPLDAAYEDDLRDAVAGVVRRQLDHGLDVVNDGELGKSSWSNYILERISGFQVDPQRLKPLDWLGRDRQRFKGFFAASEIGRALEGAPAEICVGPVAYVDDTAVRRDLANLKAAADASGLLAEQDKELFFTSVAPASTAYQGVNEYYKTEEEYVYAIADALRQEYQAVIDAGVILQVDDAVLANMYDHLIEQGERAWRHWAQLRVEALNHALEGFPEDRVRYHVCFGSWHVPHVADAPLEALTEFVLQVKAGAYSIEAANPRHEHEYRVWEDTRLPDGKILIPGVVTHHTTTVEHPELVALRIERFAKLLGPERVIAGTDCGFAQAASIQRVHPEVMWAKLSALVEGAAIASRRQWGRAAH